MNNKKKYASTFIFIFLINVITINSYGQPIPESAREKYVMGITLRDQAKIVSDYDLPITKFKEAIQLAPSWADAYKELGLTLELAGKFDDAIYYLNKYLTFNPSADDARKAQDEIYIIKAKKEKAETDSPKVETKTKPSGPDFAGLWFVDLGKGDHPSNRDFPNFYIEQNSDSWIVRDHNKVPLRTVKTQGRKLWVEEDFYGAATFHHEFVLSENGERIDWAKMLTQSAEQLIRMQKRAPGSMLSDLDTYKHLILRRK